MIQSRHGLRFSEKRLPERGAGGNARRKHLIATGRRGAPPARVDDAHAAAADLAVE